MKIDAGRIGKCLLEEAVLGRNVSTTHRLNRKRIRTAQLGNRENAGCWAFGVANPPSPVRMRASATVKTSWNRANFSD